MKKGLRAEVRRNQEGQEETLEDVLRYRRDGDGAEWESLCLRCPEGVLLWPCSELESLTVALLPSTEILGVSL